jgi:plasmid stability protein
VHVAELKVRGLDERVAAALRARAKKRGVSLEEEVRAALTRSVVGRLRVFADRAARLRSAIGTPAGGLASEGTAIIRKERDAWG